MRGGVTVIGLGYLMFDGWCDGPTTHFDVFWDADLESDIENFEFGKKMIAPGI